MAIRIQKLVLELTTTRSPRPSELVLKKSEPGALASPRGEARARVLAAASTGSPVPASARGALTPIIGRVPEGARVHTGSLADQAARSVGAQAFTLGSDIFFRAGRYNSSSAGGLALLGHEITHVQQGTHGIARKADGGPGTDRFEVEAERNEARIKSALSGQKTVPGLGASAARAGAIRRSRLPGASSGPSSPRPIARLPGRVRISSLQLICSGLLPGGVIRRKAGGGYAGVPNLALAFPLARAKGGAGSLSESILRSRGTALPAGVRSVLEPAFGQSFADVRVHTGGEAARAARSVNAEAFTLGRDVYFNSGFFEPSSPRGIALIGHELTHVAQNRGGTGAIRRRGNTADGSYTYEQRDYARLTNPGIDAVMVAEEGNRLYEDLGRAVGRYGRPVRFDDPQEVDSLAALNDLRKRQGNAEFNRAPGGIQQVERLTTWLGEQVKMGRTTEEDLILQAISDNGGNVTLAMASIAEVLYRHREWADKIDGLPYDTKDYYRFVGAYVGLQPNLGRMIGGALASHLNIAANPLGGALMGGAMMFGDKYSRQSVMRWKYWKSLLDPIASRNKLVEWHGGHAAAVAFRTRTAISDAAETTMDMFVHPERVGLAPPPAFAMKSSGADIGLAGHDSLEDQALSNERMILRAFKRGTPLTRLAATPGGGGPIRRKNWFTGWLDDNKKFWDEVGEHGITKGGVLGYAQAGFAAVASSINDPGYVYRQSKAYVQGFGIGAWDGVKGMVNMVRHPINTAEGMYNLVIHWDKAKAGLTAKVRAMLDHATSNPELFAKECGELAGQIDVALVGPKAIGGAKEVAGFLKTMRNAAALPGKTLWYYTDAAGAAGIESTSTIGRGGAAFATALDPLLGGSRSALGILARNVFLGGRLDFVVKAGKFLKLIPKMGMRVKPAFTEAVSFSGGAFKPILLTNVETGLLRAAKTISGFQFAAETPQLVTDIARHILANPTTAKAFFEAADMVQQGVVTVNGVAVSLDDIEKTDWGSVKPHEATRRELEPHRKKRGTSRFDDGDPELARRVSMIRRRHGERTGDSLELSTKYRIERLLGRELGEVRVHTGPFARAFTDATDAQALTIGREIFLPAGLDLGTPEGLGLLAHEATHVAQTGPASPTASPRSIGGGLGVDAMERVAHSVERRAVAGARGVAGALARPGAYAVAAPEPVVREAPVVVSEAPAAPSVGGVSSSMASPVSAHAPVSRREVGSSPGSTGPSEDPVQEIMKASSVASGVTPEEFMQICTGRILELMKEEIEIDNMRRETLSWSGGSPEA